MTRNDFLKPALVAAGCLLLPLVASSAEQLNVKLGLWEITSTTQMSGLPPLPKEVLDKMTPAQRARMVAEAKASAAPSVETDRECVTQEDLEHPFHSADRESCKQTIVVATRTTQEARIVCGGEHKGTGTLRISTPTPETMSGVIDLKLGDGPDAMMIKGQLKGRWLGADCGDEAEDDVDDYSDESSADDPEPLDDEEDEE